MALIGGQLRQASKLEQVGMLPAKRQFEHASQAGKRSFPAVLNPG